MNASDFRRKWAASQRTERAASQEHFIDICRLLGEKTPNEADPSGDFYTFEKGLSKTSGGDGFADVWLRGHFGWEYKGKHKDLRAAYKQLLDYHEALEQPPLLIVCDLERFEVHTKWTNTESWVYKFTIDDLDSDRTVAVTTPVGPAKDAPRLTALQVLRYAFADVGQLKPGKTTDEITKEAAALFGDLTRDMRRWKDATGKQEIDDMRIARLVTKLLFCLFATDIGLLPKESFSDIIRFNKEDAARFRDRLGELFRAMDAGGHFGALTLHHFNGSLFADDDVPDRLLANEVHVLERLDALNWADVEPAIFGTLFERVLDASTRAKLGAHYTSREDIETLVEPVLMMPLRREWADVQKHIEIALQTAHDRGATPATKAARVHGLLEPFHQHLATIRVLDPACGSGNFLYVALSLLEALEKEVLAFANAHGMEMRPRVHPRQLLGIEKNEYAHELASVVIWIGYLQWKYRNGVDVAEDDPILQKLDQVALMDTILDLSDPANPREPEWPKADVIIGNPPFLGGKRLRTELGDAYVDAMFRVWDGRVRREADLCCYWHEKARAAIASRRTKRAGLLATQAIRGGANRTTLERIKETGDIFFAESDRKWYLDGAAVQVSMVGFDDGSETQRILDGCPVEGINANLTSVIDLTTARRLMENIGISFMGDTKVGPFEISEAQARAWLSVPNPHGKPNSDVVRPWVNGLDVTRRGRGMWIVDFPPGTTEAEAALFEMPFAHVLAHVRPERGQNKRSAYAERWWIHGEPRPEMRRQLRPLARFLATVSVSKHRLMVWLPAGTLPDHKLFVFARDDDYFFGVLHSRGHTVWALATGSIHGDGSEGGRPVYNNTTCFETFPFPWPPGSEPKDAPLVGAIAEAARELNALRESWLNPPPDSIGESELKKRTLTNLYNQRPTWLDIAHRKLDAAVFAAYGWPELPAELSNQEILARLLALNLERAQASDH